MVSIKIYKHLPSLIYKYKTVLLHLQIRARNLHVVNPYKCVGPAVCRGGKIGPARWASPVRPKLGPGWAIKFLAPKKLGQIWPGPVWPSPAHPIFFLPLKYYLAQLTRFLGRARLFKFWPEKIGPILAPPGFGPAHCWPGPTRPARLPPLAVCGCVQTSSLVPTRIKNSF